MIKLTINEIPVEVEQGSTVLEAATKAGVSIPTLCHHPKLTPYGSCRLCLVQVEGAKKLQPSCTLPATDGMIIHTETEPVKKARKFVLSMLFSERNHFCMYCQETDGDCDLQQAAYREGLNNWPITPAYLPFAVDASHPDFILDNNRCIICRRCVRACDELVGNSTLGFEERGSATFLVADYGVPLGKSSCISCGNCVQICPTGALIDRRSAYQGRETDLTHTQSVCVECSLGCIRDLQTRDNRLVRLEGVVEAPFNEGLLCELGRYKPFHDDRVRLTTPLIRRNGQLEPAGWEDALKLVATQLKVHDSAEISATISPRQTAETLNAFSEFFREAFQATDVTLLGHDQTAQVSLELEKEFGAFESHLEALKRCDNVIVLGTDLVKDHQVAGFIIKRQAARGTRVFEATKQPTKLTTNATDRLACVTHDFSTVVELLEKSLNGESTEVTSELLGLGTGEVSTFFADMPAWQNTAIIIGKDFATLENLPACRALVALARRINASVLMLKGKANAAAAARIGLNTTTTTLPNQVYYLALGDGHTCEHVEEAFIKSEFRVIHASFASNLTEAADVVLPATIWDEEGGHYLVTDGHIEHTDRAIVQPENARTIYEVLWQLADKVGLQLPGDWESKLGAVEARVI